MNNIEIDKHTYIETKQTGIQNVNPPEPCIIIIFGASGDLAHRELFPALYSLSIQNLMPRPWAIIGVDIKDFSDDTFRQEMEQSIKTFNDYHEENWINFRQNMFYIKGNFNDLSTYTYLKERVEEIKLKNDIPGNILFHLATPQSFYATISERLGSVKMNNSDIGWRRIIIEKPFGDSEKTAIELDNELHKIFNEKQLYRVDHFLGKETVQNMLVFRFANPGFEPIWNRNYIKSVQITASESIGIGTRGSFYEKTGVIKDMVQNHMLQLLCMTAIEPPINYDADSLRSETVKVLKSICPLEMDNVILGQYSDGEIKEEKVKSYRSEDKVDPSSNVPTYAALKILLDNWRWAGVPFYIRTGKRMKRMFTQVRIDFKPTPHLMFSADYKKRKQCNALTFQLQPDEGIVYKFMAKQPGSEIVLQPVKMNFKYAEAFGLKRHPSAYQWLIYDVMQGDQTLFPISDWIYNAWRIVDPVIEKWNNKPWQKFPNYKAGSWGPEEAESILEPTDVWYNVE